MVAAIGATGDLLERDPLIARLTDEKIEMEKRAEELERDRTYWQSQHDHAIDAVVSACLDSREYEKERQATYLRDVLLSSFDPLMLVAQRLRKRQTLANEEPRT